MAVDTITRPAVTRVTPYRNSSDDDRRTTRVAIARRTREERALWRAINRFELGVYWRRKAVIFGQRVDIVSPTIGLVVQVHRGSDEVEAARRDASLAGRGYTVMRFSKRRCRANLDRVVEFIEREVARLCERHTVERTGPWRLFNRRRRERLGITDDD